MPGRRRDAGILVRQHHSTDCGAAALCSVSAHYGRFVSLARCRQLASTDAEGTSVSGIIAAAAAVGLEAKGLRCAPTSLGRMPLPAIAHTRLPDGSHHFLVVYRARPRYVKVMDPREGRMCRLSRSDFDATWTGILVVVTRVHPAESLVDRSMTRWQRCLSLVRVERSVLGRALVGALAYTTLGLSTALYVQKLVDHVIVDENVELLTVLGIGMIVLALVQVSVGAMKGFLVLRMGQRIDGRLISEYYAHLIRLPQQFFNASRTGDLVARVNDAVKIRALLNNLSLDIAVNAMIVLLSFALMFVYSWKLALLIGCSLPAYGLIFFVANRFNRRNQRQLIEASADLESQLVESFAAPVTIKCLGVERTFLELTEARLVGVLRPVYRAGATGILSGSATELTSRLCTILALWFGTTLVLEQSITPGQLISFYALIGYFTGPVASLIGANQGVQDALIASDRLFDILDLDAEKAGGHEKLPLLGAGRIAFERVSARHGGGAPAIREVSLEVVPGQITAIVGPTGCGKSTLAGVLLKLYTPCAGRVLVEGIDLQDIGTATVRRSIALVPQQVDLFRGTVLENITLGSPGPDLRQVAGICSELGMAPFIESLPSGLRTQLNDRGTGISGGERQRIAIARALCADPEVLILDEATSALDPGSARLVQEAIQRRCERGRTIIVIAHRLTSAMTAHKIAVMEAGRIVEEGSHEELLLRCGTYYSLWSDQFPRGEPGAPR